MITGCSLKPVAIEEVNLSYAAIRQVVISTFPGNAVREQSPNGRELSSFFFNPNNVQQEGETLNDRAFAKVIILGSSRPYRLDVRVYREVRRRGTTKHERLGEDPKLTEELVRALNENLADRREDRSIIDGFRAF